MSTRSSASLRAIRLTVIILILLLLGWVVYRSITIIHQGLRYGYLRPRTSFRRLLQERAAGYRSVSSTEPTLTIDTIQSWMTFDYLNHAFHLSPTYLSKILSIQSPLYPNISIRRYALQTHRDLPALMRDIQAALRTSSSTASPTP